MAMVSQSVSHITAHKGLTPMHGGREEPGGGVGFSFNYVSVFQSLLAVPTTKASYRWVYITVKNKRCNAMQRYYHYWPKE